MCCFWVVWFFSYKISLYKMCRYSPIEWTRIDSKRKMLLTKRHIYHIVVMKERYMPWPNTGMNNRDNQRDKFNVLPNVVNEMFKPVFLDIRSMATSAVSIFVLSICRFQIGDISCVVIFLFVLSEFQWFLFIFCSIGQ